jgi:hypothetical protein
MTWNSIKHRCHNPNYGGYKKYGALGITMCDRWRESFLSFWEDVGPRPTSLHSIDRIDPRGNYEPGNVRWALPVEQASNQKRTIYLTYKGETKPLTRWAEQIGVDAGTLRPRYHAGWTDEQIIETPTNNLVLARAFRQTARTGSPHPVSRNRGNPNPSR